MRVLLAVRPGLRRQQGSRAAGAAAAYGPPLRRGAGLPDGYLALAVAVALVSLTVYYAAVKAVTGLLYLPLLLVELTTLSFLSCARRRGFRGPHSSAPCLCSPPSPSGPGPASGTRMPRYP